jgi:hypothetical protein
MVEGLVDTAGQVQNYNHKVSINDDSKAANIKLIDFG